MALFQRFPANTVFRQIPADRTGTMSWSLKLCPVESLYLHPLTCIAVWSSVFVAHTTAWDQVLAPPPQSFLLYNSVAHSGRSPGICRISNTVEQESKSRNQKRKFQKYRCSPARTHIVFDSLWKVKTPKNKIIKATLTFSHPSSLSLYCSFPIYTIKRFSYKIVKHDVILLALTHFFFHHRQEKLI